MALILVQPAVQPTGEFALKTGQAVTGGELGIFETTGTDSNGNQIVQVRKAQTGDIGPFLLLDDGLKGYGLDIGNTIVKTDTGFTLGSDSGTRFGPPTYAGSSRVTCWDRPGLYAISLESLYDTEAALQAAAPGTGMTFDGASGKLKLGNAALNPVAYAIAYKFNESLVTTSGAVVNHKKLLIMFNPFGQP